MTYVWDTDTFTAWYTRPGIVAARLARLTPEDRVAVSVVTAYEVLRGRVAVVAQARDEQRWQTSLAQLGGALAALQAWPVLPYDAPAAARYAALRKGRGSHGTSDLRIAATALTNAATLVTRNLAHFSDLPDLAAENWVDEAPE